MGYPSNISEGRTSWDMKVLLQRIFVAFLLGAILGNLLSSPSVLVVTSVVIGRRRPCSGVRSYDDIHSNRHVQLVNVSSVEAHLVPPETRVEVDCDPIMAEAVLADEQVTFQAKPKLSIAVVMCINAKTIETEKKLEAMSISQVMLPSLQRTIEPEKYNYTLFVGMDDDDDYWMTPSVQEALQLQAGPSLSITFQIIPNKKHRIPFNEILQVAYNANSDYMVRINDDSEFITGNWTTYAINTLVNYNPPNLGVVGPTCAEGNGEILTHDMVHRTHMEVHNGKYYPEVFSNWWLDDWITQVYIPGRMTKLPNWEIKHHINHHGTRYGVNPNQGKLLGGEVEKGKARVAQYLIDITNNTKR